MRTITIEPLTKQAFEPFGDVIEVNASEHHFPINGGTTERYSDLATAIALGEEARCAISIARAQPFSLPLTLTMMERHPLGSQAFIPLRPTRFLVIVAESIHSTPTQIRAFMAAPGQGINYFVNTWHSVLTALEGETDFLIVDRLGLGENLEEHHFDEPWSVKND